VIAGPNGSGKSTFTRRLAFEGRERLLDPDAIAKRIDPEDPSRAAVAAGRETIRRTREYLSAGLSFAVETTLASHGPTDTMTKARELGFAVQLWYVCLDNPERNIRRVNERALSGGHDVPDADIRRRYDRSLGNLPEALRIANRANIYDNGDAAVRLVLQTRNGEVAWLAPDAPAWVTNAVEALTAN
jgi:predicted ABC-type ATPase